MIICGFCKSENGQSLYPTYDTQGNSYDMNSCPKCKAIFLSPYPDAERLAQAYDTSYYGEGDEKFNEGLIEKILDFFRNRRASRIARLIENKGRVLDIGCGNGRFLQMIATKGSIEGYGIEMAGKSADRAQQILGDRLHIGVMNKDLYPDNHFDAITLFHVFEHLTDPQGYLETISRILKPGGILYMSFPNIDSWQSQFFKGDWLHLDPPRHLFFFDPKAFNHQMNQYGFDSINAQYFNMEYNPFGFQQSLLNKLLDKREVLYESLKGNVDYTAEYGKWNLMFQNLFFKITAPIFIISDLVASLFRKGATVEFTLQNRKEL